MIHSAHYAMTAVFFTLFLSGALSSPLARKDASHGNTSIDDSVGFDENYRTTSGVRIMGDEPVVPDIMRWDEQSFSNDTDATAPPFTPTSSQAFELANVVKRFIFGTQDNRQYWGMGTYPFHSVGKLQWDNGVFCSGALVGPRHVLTARHCLPDQPIAGTFAPGFNDGDGEGSGHIIAAVTSKGDEAGSPCATKADWAILALDTKLGDKLGYFGVKTPDRSLFDKSILYHQGYPGDLNSGSRPYRVLDVKVLGEHSLDCDPTGPLYTDTDTAGGQSGGPLWEFGKDGGRWVWGALSIGVSWGEGLGYAGFASGAEMVDAVKKLREDYP